MKTITVFFLGVVAVSAIAIEMLEDPSRPNKKMEPKKDDVLTFQYVTGEGKYLSDMWVSGEDIIEATRYNPSTMNTFHLFTRENPALSQPLVKDDKDWLIATNYFNRRRTVVLIHGWQDNSTSAINTVLVPAFLESEDVNVIVVDWSHGCSTKSYPVAVINTPSSAVAVASFITWLNAASGSVLNNYHLVGHNLGAHQAGIIGRELLGQPGYVTGLDPSFTGWLTNDQKFQSTDGAYTEVIHTNAGVLGFPNPLADVDFYPNGGINMPGCVSLECDSLRSIHYFAESIKEDGFTGIRCSTTAAAREGHCFSTGTLNMGGIEPKTGQSGIYYLQTNAMPPFSRGYQAIKITNASN